MVLKSFFLEEKKEKAKETIVQGLEKMTSIEEILNALDPLGQMGNYSIEEKVFSLKNTHEQLSIIVARLSRPRQTSAPAVFLHRNGEL